MRGLLQQLQRGQRQLKRSIKGIRETFGDNKDGENGRKRPTSVLSPDQSPVKPVLKNFDALPAKRARLVQLTPDKHSSCVHTLKNSTNRRRVSSTPKVPPRSLPSPDLSSETDTTEGLPLSSDDSSGPKLSRTAREMRRGERHGGTSVSFHPSLHQSQLASSQSDGERLIQSLNSSRFGALDKRLAGTRLTGMTPRRSA